MRGLIVLVTVLITTSAFAAKPPDLVCQVTSGVRVLNTQHLAPEPYESQDVYRIAEGKLHLSTPDRDEYLYGDLRELEGRRYLTGHKTIVFDGKAYETAVAVHVGAIETRILRLHCVET